jgi:UDP:flavonoid glycosyltransferase YjiC (YdhE family)
LERVDAVVTHVGNSTVQQCLEAGRPMIVIPRGRVVESDVDSVTHPATRR